MNCPKIEAIHSQTVEHLGVRMIAKGVKDYDITI